MSAQLCRMEYNKGPALILWIFTELAIIGSDIQEVMGSAIALKILFGIPLFAGCLITFVDTFTFMFIHMCGVRRLEFFFAFLVGVMAVCFGVESMKEKKLYFLIILVCFSVFIALPPADKVFRGWWVPDCDDAVVQQAVGMLGAVIMPHNLFLHSALVQVSS